MNLFYLSGYIYMLKAEQRYVLQRIYPQESNKGHHYQPAVERWEVIQMSE